MCQHCEHDRFGDCGCGRRGSRGGCGCGEYGREGYGHRQHQTRDEQITNLETYLNELKSEIQSIEERLTDLRK